MANGLWTILNVSNLDKSLEFYKGIGLRAKRENMNGMSFVSIDLGGPGVLLWPKDNVAPGQAADTRAWLSGELGKGVMVSVGVANARKSWEKVQAMRVDVDSPLREQEWGGWEFTVVDPDGYVVNVTDKWPSAPVKKKAATAVKKVAKRVAPKSRTAKKTTTKKRR